MTVPDDLIARYREARRARDGVVVLEGLHALKHALRFGAEVVEARTRDEDTLRALAAELAPDVLPAMLDAVAPVSPETFARLTPSPHPTGVVALARRPPIDLADLLRLPGSAPLVLLERPTHHGNIGAVIRVAAAAGAAGVLVTGPHDPWHAASIRGAAGLQFALPVGAVDPDGVEAVLSADRPVAALDPAGHPLVAGEGTIPARAILVFGSEREGVSDRLLERADLMLSIPMQPGVSSLNLATAVAVTLYAR